MKKYPLIGKSLTVGIILLFFVTGIVSPVIYATSLNQYGKNIREKEKSPVQENVTVTFTFPENGIYWNDRKIASFSLPLILHYYFNKSIPVKFKIEPSENISKIEFYFNGVYGITWIGGPFPELCLLSISRFSHANLKIIAYTNQGEQVSNEITIWRLFL